MEEEYSAIDFLIETRDACKTILSILDKYCVDLAHKDDEIVKYRIYYRDIIFMTQQTFCRVMEFYIDEDSMEQYYKN